MDFFFFLQVVLVVLVFVFKGGFSGFSVFFF